MSMNAHRQVAVIGDGEMVMLLRLAGVQQCYPVEEGADLAEQVRQAVRACLLDESVGLIVMPQDWKTHVRGLDRGLPSRKGVLPVIVGLPEVGTREDVRRFYMSYTRQLLGIAIEI